MGLAPALKPAAWSPVPLPRYAGMADISAFPVDTGRNAVNQGGVGGHNNGANWRGNPTTMPFTAQPGPVYGTHLNSKQPYRATAGWQVQITPVTPGLLPAALLRGYGTKSGGVPAANAVQARMAALIAQRQRAANKRGKR